MNAFCDLHTHSHFSDGTLSPARLVVEAEAAGLAAVALTDHNTVAGLAQFLEAAEGRRLRAVPGVEISTDFQDRELHILGFFLPEKSWSQVSDYLKTLNDRKTESNRLLVRRLQEAGYALDFEQILQSSQGTVNRAVIAAKMVELGYVASVKEAFKGLLSEKNGLYTPPKRLDAFEAIAFLRSVGAAAVLAHPYLSVGEEQLRQFLPEAIRCGLMAMETHYSTYSPETTEAAVALAAEFGLLESGGSDFHGENKPDIRLGIGRGNLMVPIAFLEQLEAAL